LLDTSKNTTRLRLGSRGATQQAFRDDGFSTLLQIQNMRQEGVEVSSKLIDPYFLKSERLGFRCWSREDFPLAKELWGDVEVTRFFGGPFSDEEVRVRLEHEIERMNTHKFQYWPIFLLRDNEHVGCCGLRPYGADAAIPELGFHLRPKYWGQGLAVEAARTVIDCALETIGAKGLAAGHHPENVNSKRVMAKLGFRYTRDEFFPGLGMTIPYYLLMRETQTSEIHR
jgi:ribosomal-protein-alanine N-acetyltransferase